MGTASTQNLLVYTKLRRPRALGQLVHRPRLSELLNRGATLPLTMVSAPPGYGKTTLVNLWMDEVAIPWAWYAVDQNDNALSTFVTYLAAALATAYPGCGTTVRAVLQSPAAPQPEHLADVFIGELDAIPGELLLVVEDYHLVTHPDIHAFMSALVQNAPAHVHFVLLVRSDPPLKLARLRARQQLLEVRARQLRFTLEETRELLRCVLGDLATESIVTLFAERTEGWAAGIHLAATSMRDSSNAAAFAIEFARSGSQVIVDFLVSEVLDQLAPQERELLLRTAVLPRFCAPLCDIIMPQAGQDFTGEEFIRRLRAMNPFLVALDEEGYWYRFHHLFADILRHRLRLEADEGMVAALHSAASGWFEANSLIDEAIAHALSAGDPQRAARLVETYGDSLLDQDNWRALERWLALLPEAQTQRPAVLVAMGWLEQFRYRPAAIFAKAHAAEAALAESAEQYTALEVRRIQGRISALRALASTYSGRWADTLAFAEDALAAMQTETSFARGLTELTYIRATSRSGKPRQAVELAQGWLQQQGPRSHVLSLRLLLAICGTLYDLQDLDELCATALTYRQLAQQIGRPLSVAWTSWMLGVVHYQRNELPKAEHYYSEVVLHPYEAHTRTVIDCWIGLCLSLRAQGRHEQAIRQADALRTFLLRGGQIELAAIADALAAYLELLAGRTVRVSQSYSQDLPRQLGLDLVILPALVWVLGCIRSGERNQQAAAAEKLAELRMLLVADHLPRCLLETELLEALLHAGQENHKAALEAVRRAVAIAEPGGAVRFFVDAGSDLLPYLYELAAIGVAPGFVARILDAFGPQASAVLRDEPRVRAQSRDDMTQGPDALTNREIDVLVLLEQRLSNKEIAAALYISPLTVKRHTRSIYSKLDVNSRRAAVARAKGLGLITVG